MFGGTFAPQGWAFCDGQLLSIQSNTALFSLLGTTFGGNGTTNFALPDLRGRAPLGPGQGPGLANRLRGENGGTETHTLDASQMPTHVHTFRASGSNGTTDRADTGVPARAPSAVPEYGPNANADLAPGALQAAGGGQAHNNMQPFLTLHYIIALNGTFPSRPAPQR